MQTKQKLSFAILAASVLATGGLLAGGHESEGGRSLPPVANAQWQAECGACHQAYHPGLLPARSWQSLMAGLERHFGENAALDADTSAAIERFLVASAADRNGNRRSERIASSIPSGTTSLRISETPYIRAKHAEIRAEVFQRPAVASRGNCAACHTAAARGDFAESGIRIPKAGPLAAAPAVGAMAK
jgi:mono/diheme cytochrome c family protein